MIEDSSVVSQLDNKGAKAQDLSCYYGDTCGTKNKQTIRIMFQNVNGFGYTTDSVISQSIRSLMVRKRVDIMALAEMNINWGKVSRTNTLPHVCRNWFETSKATVSYNQHEKRKKNKHQPGGTAIVSIDDMALRHHKHEYDKKKMGRWASQAFSGKNGLVTRVVSVYIPIIMKEHGHKKVSCQQQRALLSMGVKSHFITVFFQDFWEQIDKWLTQGDQLVICGDWNTDIRNKRFLKEFKKNL